MGKNKKTIWQYKVWEALIIISKCGPTPNPITNLKAHSCIHCCTVYRMHCAVYDQPQHCVGYPCSTVATVWLHRVSVAAGTRTLAADVGCCGSCGGVSMHPMCVKSDWDLGICLPAWPCMWQAVVLWVFGCLSELCCLGFSVGSGWTGWSWSPWV